MFAYVNMNDGTANKNSITFTFTGLATGSGTFSTSEPVLSGNASISGGTGTNVTVVTASKNNSNSNKNTNTNKPKNNTSNNNTNQNENPQEGTQNIIKTQLDEVLVSLEGLIETDYTADSWKALQEAIERAKNANTAAEYDEIKNNLTIDNLVVEEFEKDELINMLIQLMGKSQKDYTEESWQELQDAIAAAQNSKLKSEYDAVKEKLTIETLAQKVGVKEFFENFIQGLERKDPFYLAFAGCVLVLLLVILILLIVVCRSRKGRKEEYSARRMR